MKNSNTNAQKLQVVSKAQQIALSVPTPKVTKKVTPKAAKIQLHKALLECNKMDKAENFSLSGALNRLKKQISKNPDYKKIDSNRLNSAMTFDNLLANVNARCITSQRFTVYALGLAVNRQLKK